MSLAFLALLAVLLGLAVARVPIPFAMLSAGFVYLAVSGQDLGLVTDQVMNSLFNNYVLLAIPMFVLAANVMNAGTISERLWRAADTLVGRARGGLGHVAILVSMVFSSMSGSAVADAAGPGLVSIRMMQEVGGYRGGLAVAITAAAAVIAPIIPPSIPMVLYALNSGASVGALFLGGVVPGLFIGVSLMATLALVARRAGLPAGSRRSAAETRAALGGALVPLSLPAILLGGIWSGIFTPTEAAAVAALWAFFLAIVVYRALTPLGVWRVLRDSMTSSVVVMLLIAGAFLINYAVTAERLDRGLADLVTGADLSAWQFLAIVNVLFLLLGCIIDTGTLLLVLVPLLMPTVHALGIDPVHFGVVITVNIMIGLVTPPFGLLLFVLGRLTHVGVGAVVRDLWPFVLTLIGCLVVLTYVPAMVLALPRAFGFD
ncbi:TRAP transporter large permease [Acuticoccus mangrovi]|uniref:TRAP transporter large permease protein n=1 Tax=Acuticoccus mangrovi TaxID=2796142 RepID=A0A934MFM6_9HYPH|nr:TRAP transporter large permease [Acuticoccus mangrovi]MBJ3775090.1 TRAP transporter large permease [Acuticoccus mangrovi]